MFLPDTSISLALHARHTRLLCMDEVSGLSAWIGERTIAITTAAAASRSLQPLHTCEMEGWSPVREG